MNQSEYELYEIFNDKVVFGLADGKLGKLTDEYVDLHSKNICTISQCNAVFKKALGINLLCF